MVRKMETRYTFCVVTHFTFGVCIILLFVNVCLSTTGIDICDRRPFKTNTDSLSPDDRFVLEIESNTGSYIPNQKYNVRLFSKDNKTTFMGFSIWLREHEVENEKNKRRPRRLDPGKLHPSPSSPFGGRSNHPCNNTVVQVDITPKTSVQALWTAPGKGNDCVTLNAIVAIKPDVWYANEGPLSKQVCEDTRDADDIPPTQNDDCQVCEEARYQLTFRGMWSFNTHPNMFPKDHDIVRFSDVVGASHSLSFIMYRLNSEASSGIQMLAEQGNTTDLELEIQKELGRSVRTVIKASAPAKTNLTTVTSFRVSKEHHFVSLATGIMPSPDWFLGVANLELCRQTRDGGSEWAPTVTLNLDPYDAGTDSGKDFESSNDKTSPPQPISLSWPMVQNSGQGKKKAFARVRFDLIRTYPNPNCALNSPTTTTERDEEEERYDGNWQEPDESEVEIDIPPPRIPEPEITTTSERTDVVRTVFGECPVTAWDLWPCQTDGECVDGLEHGFREKIRYNIVDGIVVGKYDASRKNKAKYPPIPRYCKDLESTNEMRDMEECTKECTEETTPTGEATENEGENK